MGLVGTANTNVGTYKRRGRKSAWVEQSRAVSPRRKSMRGIVLFIFFWVEQSRAVNPRRN